MVLASSISCFTKTGPISLKMVLVASSRSSSWFWGGPREGLRCQGGGSGVVMGGFGVTHLLDNGVFRQLRLQFLPRRHRAAQVWWGNRKAGGHPKMGLQGG